MEAHPSETAALVALARCGDDEAWRALVARFGPLARGTARRLVADPSATEDVVQEAFTEAFLSLPRLRTAEAFPAWLRLIVRKHADRHQRRRRSTAALDDATFVVDTIHDDPSETAQRRQLAEQVRAAVAGARDADRTLLELRYLADWSIAELAAELDVAPGTVRKRLHDARVRIRPSLVHLREEPAMPDPAMPDPTMPDPTTYLGSIHAPGTIRIGSATVIAPPTMSRHVTGLRALDTFAPICRGGTVELVGPAGTGHVVLVVELTYRLGRTGRETACVAVGPVHAAIGAWPNFGNLVTELPEHGRHAVVLHDDDTTAPQALADGAALAAALAATGVDTLLVVDRQTTDHAGGSEAIRRAAGTTGEGSVTAVLLDARAPDAPTHEPVGLDTRIALSREQVTLGVFPALDPAESGSAFHHDAVADEARALWTRAAELRSFIGQPMYVAADHTGEAGIWVEPSDADEQLASLVTG